MQLFFCLYGVMKNKKKLYVFVLDLIVAAAVVSTPYLLSMFMNKAPDCWLLNMGIICPACGGTRCLSNFLRGRFFVAFRYNQMFFLLGIYTLILLLMLNMSVFSKWSFPAKIVKIMVHPRTVITIAILFVCVGFLRNFWFRDFFLL